MRARLLHELGWVGALAKANRWPAADPFQFNGVALFPGLLSMEEASELGRRLRQPSREGKSRLVADAACKSVPARELVWDPRLLEAVSRCIGGAPKFLQAADIAQDRNSTTWHRDSPCRRFASGGDWGASYSCVKAIVYLEGGGSALGVVPGSHRRSQRLGAIKRVAMSAYRPIDAESLNRRLYGDVQWNLRPALIRVHPGDCVVFDTRVLHRGVAFGDDGRPHSNHFCPGKLTLNLCYGRDDVHARRFYSYFRYVRADLGYQAMPKELRVELRRRGLLLESGEENLFAVDPEQASGIYVRNPPGRRRRFREQVGPL